MDKKEKKNPLLYLFDKTWQYSKGNQRNIVLYWSMFIVGESVDVFCMPLVWAKMIDVITQQGITPLSIKTLELLLGIVFLRVVIVWSFHGPARLIELSNAFKARVNYRGYLTKGLLTLPLEWHTEHNSGDTTDRCGKGTTALYEFSEDSFEVIYSFVRLLGCYGMLAYFSHSSAYIVLMMMLISAWITMHFDKKLIGQYREINRSENQISESIIDVVSKISTVIILRAEKLIFDTIMHKVEKPFELVKKTNRLNEWKWFLTSFCCTIMKILVLGVYFWQNLGAISGTLAGSVYLLINYLNQIGDLFFRFAGMYSDIVKRKTRIMNAEELAVDFRAENLTNHVLPADWKRLNIENLNFSYKVEGTNVNLSLRDISMSISRGENIAFVGGSGSGKTTTLMVIRDIYHPDTLSLTADKKIIQGFEGICRAIALIPQNPEIFSTTILSNVTMGAEHDMEFVRKFTDMALFTEVVESLPKKFDSSVKEKGVNLSGGEQQRLGLSRGLLTCHDKDIILLDEATSSVDPSKSVEIYQNIFKEFKDKTIICSTHQFYLLPLFDRIYVFDKGKIVGSGSLDTLLVECPEFQKLWSLSNNQQ